MKAALHILTQNAFESIQIFRDIYQRLFRIEFFRFRLDGKASHFPGDKNRDDDCRRAVGDSVRAPAACNRPEMRQDKQQRREESESAHNRQADGKAGATDRLKV